MSRLRTGVPTVLAVLGLTLGWTSVGAAGAHASLVGSTPVAGRDLRTAPTSVRLRFDENIREPSTVIVTGPDGRRVDRGATRVLDDTASVAVGVRYAGEYTVAFRVLSSDGHPVSDTVRFGFHGPGAPTPERSAAAAATPARSSSTPWVVGAAAAAGVVVVGAGLGLARRRRPGR